MALDEVYPVEGLKTRAPPGDLLGWVCGLLPELESLFVSF